MKNPSMISFTQYLRESPERRWKPLQGKELKREFHPRGGEIDSQLKSYDKGHMKAPQSVIDGMRFLHSNPQHLAHALSLPREEWNKKRIRSENVLNTSAHDSWEDAKGSLDNAKVLRAEQNRKGIQTSPTMLRVTDERGKTHHWLLGGNTRLTAMEDTDSALVHVIDPSEHLRKRV